MEAPKEIYLWREALTNPTSLLKKKQYDDDVKYIRADLAELNWIDIREILKIANEVEQQEDTSLILKSELCDEILRRFMDYKAGKK